MISPGTALAVRSMLELVVQPGGTAPRAQVMGYRVAGKTGTAHKLEGHGYAADRYVSSFVGLAPASDPRLLIAVMLDEPGDGQYYGGVVAAPVFSRVMSEALRMLSVPPDAPMTRGCAVRCRARSDARRCEHDAHASLRPSLSRSAERADQRLWRPTAVACSPATYSSPCPGGRADGAHASSRRRSPPAPPRVLWEADGFSWDPAWQVPNLPVSQICASASESSQRTSTAIRRAACGWPV